MTELTEATRGPRKHKNRPSRKTQGGSLLLRKKTQFRLMLMLVSMTQVCRNCCKMVASFKEIKWANDCLLENIPLLWAPVSRRWQNVLDFPRFFIEKILSFFRGRKSNIVS